MPIRLPDVVPDHAADVAELDVAEPDAVFVAADDVGTDWGAVSAELTAAFETSRTVAQAAGSIVFVVANADLLGQRGPGNAMVSTGLLSAARTLAIEAAKWGGTANVVAAGPDAGPTAVADWTRRLLEADGVSGELIRVGGGHLGKALP